LKVEKRLEVIRSITEHYWELVLKSEKPQVTLREFCGALEASGALSLSVVGDLSHIQRPAIFISNHVTVIEPLKILANGSYSAPYHSLLMDYVIERETGLPVSHISANPRAISPALEDAAERLGFILTEKKVTPSNWKLLCRRVAEKLNTGSHISLAPEGHFHAWNSVGPFKRGFWHWAKENACAILPTLLRGFETMGPELEFTFATPEMVGVDSDPEIFVDELRERVFGEQFQLRLL
jgi:1-acyl-sn-glycerol-3-phosphate acyltransferase